MNDPVKHPNHYVAMACVIEPIELTGTMNSALGQILQYVIRYKLKGDPKENLEKARFWTVWFIEHYFAERGCQSVEVQTRSTFEDVCIRKTFNMCYRTEDAFVNTIMYTLTEHEQVTREDMESVLEEINMAIDELKVTHYE